MGSIEVARRFPRPPRRRRLQRKGKDMSKDTAAMYYARCKRCGHDWLPRVLTPRRCPSCNSPKWNTPRKVTQ